MRCPRTWKMTLALILGASLTGSVCGLGCIEKVANNFNPCGTILNCDPAEYDLMMNDWPNWDLDPTCTIPGQCGGVFPYNTTSDNTTTSTDTTQTTTTTGSLFSYY